MFGYPLMTTVCSVKQCNVALARAVLCQYLCTIPTLPMLLCMKRSIQAVRFICENVKSLKTHFTINASQNHIYIVLPLCVLPPSVFLYQSLNIISSYIVIYYLALYCLLYFISIFFLKKFFLLKKPSQHPYLYKYGLRSTHGV